MKFTEQNKSIMFDNLSSLIGGNHIKLFNLPDIKNELSKMQRNPKSSGRGFSIEAPKGRNEHDDIPVALALACMQIQPRLKVQDSGTGPGILLGQPSVWSSVEW